MSDFGIFGCWICLAANLDRFLFSCSVLVSFFFLLSQLNTNRRNEKLEKNIYAYIYLYSVCHSHRLVCGCGCECEGVGVGVGVGVCCVGVGVYTA